MCGIVGYIRKNQAIPILLDVLRKLEYRGYDFLSRAVYGKPSKVNVHSYSDCSGKIQVAI